MQAAGTRSRARRRNSQRLGRLVSTVPITHDQKKREKRNKTSLNLFATSVTIVGQTTKGLVGPAPSSNTIVHQTHISASWHYDTNQMQAAKAHSRARRRKALAGYSTLIAACQVFKQYFA